MAHTEPVVPVLLGMLIIIVSAKVGAYFSRKCSQPPVLGELVVGILLGNAVLLGWQGFEYLKTDQLYEIFAQIGVVILLFEVGLELELSDLLKVGVTSLLVAVVGVVGPMALGWGVAAWLLPDLSPYCHAFVGATLCATSVGITARVLKDLKKIDTSEAKIILGAAVIDDVLGLLILAVITGIITAASQSDGEGLAISGVVLLLLKALGFLGVSVVAGLPLSRWLFRVAERLQIEGAVLALGLAVCFGLAYASHLVGLAPIVGAFAAGLIIDDPSSTRRRSSDGSGTSLSLNEGVFALSAFFVPVFFVTMGMKVNLRTFSDLHVLQLGLLITVAAVIGKQACGLVVNGKGVNRWAIGIGMVPRGEVGLIFASIGASLVLDGRRIIDETLFSAIVIMVMVTTLVAPPGLKWALTKRK